MKIYFLKSNIGGYFSTSSLFVWTYNREEYMVYIWIYMIEVFDRNIMPLKESMFSSFIYFVLNF